MRLRIEDTLEAAERNESYVAGLTLEEFQADRKTIDAVVRNLEIIGEAARHLVTIQRGSSSFSRMFTPSPDGESESRRCSFPRGLTFVVVRETRSLLNELQLWLLRRSYAYLPERSA